jgi:hypothetical protein
MAIISDTNWLPHADSAPSANIKAEFNWIIQRIMCLKAGDAVNEISDGTEFAFQQ